MGGKDKKKKKNKKRVDIPIAEIADCFHTVDKIVRISLIKEMRIF